MSKQKLTSPILQKLEEVLIELKINYEISDEEYFILPDEQIIIDESNKVENHFFKSETFALLEIFRDGKIIDLYNDTYIFKFCTNCNKFFLEKESDSEECIFCNDTKVLYLSQDGKIPNWNFNLQEEYILAPDFSLPSINSLKAEKQEQIQEIAKIFQGKPPIRIDLGNDVPTFTCVGSDPGYTDAKQGLILESMFAEDDGHPIKNPIIHFDELDKINSDNKYSIETIFYSILERSTSKNFRDNFFGVDVDASGINYIFTANSIENIPKPILNRLRIFEIPDYTKEQLRNIVIDNFYQNWLKNNNLKKECFPEVLSNEIKDEIIKISKCDSRSINDAFTELFAKTMRVDDKTGERIALFSDSELYGGWEHYRGKRDFSNQKWKLPDYFRRISSM